MGLRMLLLLQTLIPCLAAYIFESVIVSRILVGHVMFLKGLIAAAFESSELLHLLRLGVSAHPYIE